jgi:hypothetical protein
MAENIKEKIEDKIIDLITLGAPGRLVVFKPENSDKDLIVEKRADYKKEVISLNIYGSESSGSQDFGKEIHQLTDKTNLNAEENFYLIFVYFDVVKQDINDNFLVVPSLGLQNLVKTNDFSKFLISKKDFIRFLIGTFEKK